MNMFNNDERKRSQEFEGEHGEVYGSMVQENVPVAVQKGEWERENVVIKL